MQNLSQQLNQHLNLQPVFYTPKLSRTQSRISKTEVSPFKLGENFVDKIRDEEKYIND